MELTKRATAVGLFPGLLNTLTSGSGAIPYNVPHGEQLKPINNNKRASNGQFAPAAKRSKASIDREGVATPGSSRASSHQPQGITEGWPSEPSGLRNPFSRPSSAGPVAMPFAKSANSTPMSKLKIKDEHIEQEQIEPSLRALSQGAELQGIAAGATEYQRESQDIQQATQDAQGHNGQVEISRESSNPGPEAQQPTTEEQQQGQAAQQSHPQQTEQADTVEGDKPDYDDLLKRVENEVFYAHGNEPPEEQLQRAPAVAALVEGTAGTIHRQFKDVVEKTDASGRRDHFLSSLSDTAFALLWVLESCALNQAGTPLAAEVSRRVSRDALVGALWGSVRLATASECLTLVSDFPPFHLCHVVHCGWSKLTIVFSSSSSTSRIMWAPRPSVRSSSGSSGAWTRPALLGSAACGSSSRTCVLVSPCLSRSPCHSLIQVTHNAELLDQTSSAGWEEILEPFL